MTQSTNWTNVERAIENLKKRDLLAPQRLFSIGEEELSELIRPSGYYRIKSERLKAFVHFLFQEYHGNLDRMFSEDDVNLRAKLLGVKGIGEETADSILLYAGGKPFFVVDAYTHRILHRHGLVEGNARYEDIQRLFMSDLPREASVYNQYHALLVNTGKQFCRKKPRCEECPLNGFEIVKQKRRKKKGIFKVDREGKIKCP